MHVNSHRNTHIQFTKTFLKEIDEREYGGLGLKSITTRASDHDL